MSLVTRPSSLVGRLVGLTVCFSLASASAADGAAFATGSFAAWLQDLVQGRPGPYTDQPIPVRVKANRTRDTHTRGGIWNEESLHALAQAEEKWGAEPGTRGFMASLEGAIFVDAGDGSGGGDPLGGEGKRPTKWKGVGVHGFGGSGGIVNTWNGNHLHYVPLTGFDAHGDLAVNLTLYHNSYGTYNGPFGKGWSHSYDIKVEGDYGDPVVVRYGDGTVLPFTYQGTTTYGSPSSTYDKLKWLGSNGWEITRQDKSKLLFTPAGALTTVQDRSGNQITISDFMSTRTITSAGRWVRLNFNGQNRVSGVTDSSGRSWTFTYTGSQLTKITYPTLSGTNPYRDYTYSAGDDILTERDLNGNIWTYTYLTSGTLLTEKNPLNETTTYSYTTSTCTQTLPLGQSNTDYYVGSLLDTTSDEAGFTEEFDYNAKREVTYYRDKRGFAWNSTYDAYGNQLTATNPLSKTWTYTYNSDNDLLTAKNPYNNTYTCTVDAAGHVLTLTDPLNRVTVTNTYDSLGNLATTKDALNNTTTLGYTGPDVTSVTDPLSHTTSITYDSMGRVLTVTDPLGNTQSMAYDEWGRPTTVTHPGGSSSSVEYDLNGNTLEVTDELGHSDTLVYNAASRMTSHANAIGNTENYVYDANGRNTTITNARGYTRTYTYTNRGEPYTLTLPDGAVETWSYNAAGLSSAYTNPLNQVIGYYYDNASRHTKVDYPTGTDTLIGYDDADRIWWMLDNWGNTTWTYNAASELTRFSQPNGVPGVKVHVDYTYDAAGRTATMTDVGGAGVTTYLYDAASRLTQLASAGGQFAWEYDVADRVTKQRNLTNAADTTYGYDNRSRLTSIKLWPTYGFTPITSQVYEYDNASRLIKRTFDGVETTFGYDDADQLTLESRPGYICSYSYDANGNRLYKTLNTVTESYSYDAADKMLTAGAKSYVYDAAGRTTRITQGGQNTDFAYDYGGRIASITYPNSSTNSFVYDGFGARGKKVDSQATNIYKRAVPGVVSGVLQDGAKFYVPGLSERVGSTSTYYHTNFLGSTERALDVSQATVGARQYDAFGNTASTSGTLNTPFAFAGAFGYQSDADSGFQLLGHRYMDPSTGRFLTRDPAMDGRNWYVYCENDPLSFVDPSGLYLETAFDVGMLCLSVKDFWDEPSFINGLCVVADGLSVLLPVPAVVGGVRHADDLLSGLNHLDDAADAATHFGRQGSKACFVAGTQVVMADGSTKAIEDVRPGDHVLSRSEAGDEDGVLVARQVNRAFAHRKQGTLLLKLEDGQLLETTEEHPFYVEAAGFVEAGNLTVHDRIAEDQAETTRILSIVRLSGTKTAYNFEVDGTHTYFVKAGDDSLWVHNKPIGGPNSKGDDMAGVYLGPGKFTGLPYVGESKEVPTRIGSGHHKLKRGEPVDFFPMPGSTKLERQRVEQDLIDHFGLANLENERNAIGKKRWFLR